MKKFCVSYDLIDENTSRVYLDDKLNELNGKRIQESVWILKLDDEYDCDILETELTNYFSKKDRLFITKISRDHVINNPLYP